MTQNLTDLAKVLPGIRKTMLHKDMERLGYLFKQGKKWMIAQAGTGLFAYKVDPKWGSHPAVTDAGRECILTHYMNNELTMHPLYKDYGDSRLYHTGCVVKLALENQDRLTTAERDLVVEVLNGRNEYDAYHPTISSPVTVNDRLQLLGHKLDGYRMSESYHKYLSGWRYAKGRFGGPLYPPATRMP